jgi:hypothetical protein
MGVIIVRILGVIVTVCLISLYGIYFYRKGFTAGVNHTVIKRLLHDGSLSVVDELHSPEAYLNQEEKDS